MLNYRKFSASKMCIILVIIILTISQCQSNIILKLEKPEQLKPIMIYKLDVSFPTSAQINESQISCQDHAKSGKRSGLRKIDEDEANGKRTIRFDVVPLEDGQLVVCSLDGIESNRIPAFTGKTYTSYVMKINIPSSQTGPEFASTIMHLIQPSIFDVSFAGETNSLQAITSEKIAPESVAEMQFKIPKKYDTKMMSSVLCQPEYFFKYNISSTRVGKYVIPDENAVDEDENTIRMHCEGDYYKGGTWSEVDKIKLRTSIRTTIKIDNIVRDIQQFGMKQSIDVKELSQLATLIDYTAKSQTFVVRKLQQNKTTKELLQILDRKLLNITSLPMVGFRSEVRKRFAIRVENLHVTGSAGLLALTNNAGNTTNIDSIVSLLHNDSRLVIQTMSLIAAVRLPESVLKSSERAVFAVQSHGNLFSTSSNTSAIVGAELSGGPYENLPEPVRIYFRRDQAERPHRGECVSWDFSLNDGFGDWSTRGCKFYTTHYDANIQFNDDANRCEESKLEGVVLDECWCYHLTHFGELFLDHSLHETDSCVHENTNSIHVNTGNVLDVISLVGVSISLVCLTAVLISTFAFPKLIQRPGQKTKIQITSNLAVLLLLFLIASQLPTGLPIPARVILGIAIHYSMLCNFSCMLIAAIMQYRRLVVVFTTDSPKLNRIYIVVAWVVPMVPPIVVLATGNYHAYIKPPLYLPQGLTFYLSLALPLLLVLLCNGTVFVMIARSLYASTNIRVHGGDRKNFVVRFRQLVFLFMLLGLSWVFAFCQIMVPESMVIVFSYLFCFSIAIQGPAYLVFFVIMDQAAIKEWKKLLCCKGMLSETATSTSRTNGKHTYVKNQSKFTSESGI